MSPSFSFNRPRNSDLSASFVRHLTYPLWAAFAGRTHAGYARLFSRTQYLSTSALADMQSAHLRTLLLHAYRNVPFYKRRMEMAGITPLDIRSVADLPLLPALTGSDIRTHQAELLTADRPEREHRMPGGLPAAAAQPFPLASDRVRAESRAAGIERNHQWAGIKHGAWCAVLERQSGSGEAASAPLRPSLPAIDWRQRLVHRRLTLSLAHDSSAQLPEYLELLRRYNPRHLVADAQSAAMLALYCNASGAEKVRFESAAITGRTLFPEVRDLIQTAFSTRVFHQYGSRGLPVLASECDRYSGLHVNADALIVEIDPLPGLSPGVGRVLVTDLFNRSFPLIRYEVGDVAGWTGAAPCACGRSLPRLDNIGPLLLEAAETPAPAEVPAWMPVAGPGHSPKVAAICN